MTQIGFKVHRIPFRGATPWSRREQIGLLLWTIVWPALCGWTPKHFNPWRLIWLKLFGCKIEGTPFVHQRARMQAPWRLTLGDQSSVGDRANLYSLDEIELGRGSVIAQEAYLCTGSHDFSDPNRALLTARITVGADAFVGARAFVMPGVTIGDRAVVGACSVVTESVEPGTMVAGSPARFLRFTEPSLAESL